MIHTEEQDTDMGKGTVSIRRPLQIAVMVLLAICLSWWIGGRLVLDHRSVRVHHSEPSLAFVADSIPTLRVLAWNIAHGRGTEGPGLFRNFRGGSAEERIARIARIATVLREADADIVILNEVDFDAAWTGGINQAEVLARAAGYPVRVEQVNYDMRIPFATLSFGNAVLTRLPIVDARRLDIPPHSGLEARLAGAKNASVVRFDTPIGPVALVPIHLEVRSEATRLSAVPVLDSLRHTLEDPVILAGDFNSSPPGWPFAVERTALGELLRLGWRSPRAEAVSDSLSWTYPTFGLDRGIDWVLAEPPLRVIEARILADAWDLSDHAPVLSIMTVDPEG